MDVFSLQRRQRGGDLNHSKLSACIHLWVCVSDIIQDVQHQGAIPGAQLVDYKVVVGVEGQLVVGH